MVNLAQFRAEIDDFMAHHPQSPLDHEQRANFSRLPYYDESETLQFVVEVERFPQTEPMIEMETSTGDTRHYRRWGQFAFVVDGETAVLTIYSDMYGQDFFLPFKDATNGKETYGAGRYLDNHRPGIRPLGGNQVEINFNFAYNPYCAYSEQFSCPLPPRENWLQVPIKAGEKTFTN